MRKTLLFLLFPLLLYAEPSLRDIRYKAGQLVMAVVPGKELSAETLSFLKESHLGNVILFPTSNGLQSAEQVKQLTTQLREAIIEITGLPPLIAIDQEGGSVVRLEKEFTIFPGNGALGKANSPALAFAAGLISAEELSSVGINTSLGPVLDTNTNPKNPVIGIRSFGSDPKQVATLGKEMIRGLKQGGVVTVLKHFPGHGDTAIDSHFSLPVCDKNLERLSAEEFYPFHELSPFADAIMTAHVLYPALDPKKCATLSAPILRTLLRNTWGFQGVIFSDSIAMSGLAGRHLDFASAQKAISEKAIEALRAGCDCLIIAIDPRTLKATEEEDLLLTKTVIDAICDAVTTGKLSAAEIDASYQRVLKLKAKLTPSSPPLPKHPHPIAEHIAKKALTLLTPEEIAKELPPFSSYTIVSPDLLKNQLKQTLDSSAKTHFFSFPLSAQEKETLLKTLQPPLLFLSYKAIADPEQRLLLEALAGTLTGRQLIIAGVGNPSDVENPLFSQSHLTYQTFSPAPPSLRALLSALQN